MSIARCLKRVGLSKHEAAVLKGTAADLRSEEGLSAQEAAIEAVRMQLEDLQGQRDNIVAKVSGDLAPQAETIRAKPGANTRRLTKLLGPGLYGSPSDIATVSVKELVQNAFDGIKPLLQNGSLELGKIDIDVDEQARTITVADNGSGMEPEVLATKFLEIAGTRKEGKDASGGLGIAKMLFLFANEKIRVETVRNGKLAVLESTGPALEEAMDNPELAPDIDVQPTDRPSGTTVTVTVPKTFRDTQTGEEQSIKFPNEQYAFPILMKSPLFQNIEVSFNGSAVYGMGSRFPADNFTQFADVKFPWGMAHIYVSKEGKGSKYGKNVHVLSNGLWQFSSEIKKNPQDPWGENIPRTFYVNVSPNVKPEDPGYPIALNRQGFAPSTNDAFTKILNYIGAVYRSIDLSSDVDNFGSIQYLNKRGGKIKVSERVLLSPPKKAAEAATEAIREGDKVEVLDGKLYVRGRQVPELTPDQLRGGKLDLDQFKVDQQMIFKNEVMLHSNLDVPSEDIDAKRSALQVRVDEAYQRLMDGPMSEYEEAQAAYRALREELDKAADKSNITLAPIVEVAAAKFGNRFYEYANGVGGVFLRLRNLVAEVMGYDSLKDEAIGVSFDKEYRGVSIRIPFSGMFVNPAVPEKTDPARAGLAMFGTMVHELAHHKERSHDAQFPAEMQRILYELEAAKPAELRALKKELTGIALKHNDILKFLEKVTNDEHSRPSGKRLTDRANEARDGGAVGDVVGSRNARQRVAGVRRGSEAGTNAAEEGGNAAGVGDAASLLSRKESAGKQKLTVAEGADAIRRMDADARDNTELQDMPGGAYAYNLFEAQNLLPKPSGKLKRVTENNSFSLWTDYDYVANVDGDYYGISKYEDPDNEEGQDESNDKFVYAYQRLDRPRSATIETDINVANENVADLIEHIRLQPRDDSPPPVFSRGEMVDISAKEGEPESPLHANVPMEGRTGAQGRLTRALKRPADVGGPDNERTVLSPKVVVGKVTPADWLARVKATLSTKQLHEARTWYGQLYELMSRFFSKEMADRYSLAWLLSQQMASPSKGFLDVLRAADIVAGSPVLKKAGLGHSKLIQVLRGEAPSGGYDAKLLDFIDSELQKSTRTVMGNDPRGGGPAVIDVWANRDVGKIDSVTHKWIRKTFGAEVADNLQIDGERIAETDYEYGSKFYNDVAAELNRLGYDGGNWQPYEVQAVGWVTMQMVMGETPETPLDVFNKNTRRASIGVLTHDGKPIKETAVRRAINAAAKAARVVVRDIQVGLGSYLGDKEGSLQVDVMASPEGFADFAAVVGHILRQTEVIVSRALKSGKATGFTLYAPEFANMETVDKFMSAVSARVKAAVPDATIGDGFQMITLGGRPALGLFHGVYDDATGRVLWKGNWSPKEIKAFREALGEVTHEQGIEIDVSQDKFDIHSEYNDWKRNPAGEAYRDSLLGRGRKSLGRGLGTGELQLLEGELSGGERPALHRYSDAGTGRGGGSGVSEAGIRPVRAERGAQDQRGQTLVPAGYPQPSAGPRFNLRPIQPGAVQITGIHYGNAGGLSELTGGHYGQGAPGEEAARLDAQLRQRVYFYAQHAGMPRAEGVVTGNHVYRTVLTNMLDLRSPQGQALIRMAPRVNGRIDYNAFEKSVIEAGFDGYVDAEGAMRDTAVVLGSHVEVEYLGTRQQVNAAAFARGAAVEPQGVQRVKGLASGIMGAWKNAPRLQVVQSVSDLPFRAYDDVKGAYWKGTVYLVADNLSGDLDVETTLFHEARGHYGLRGLFGSQLGFALRRIAAQNANIREAAERWKQNNPRPAGQTQTDYDLLAIEEALANLAGKNTTFTGLKQFIAALQGVLRKAGLGRLADWLESATDAQALALLAQARTFVEEGANARVDGAVPAMSSPNIWRSRMREALASKAPFSKDGNIDPKQLRQWLAARTKDGTVSAEEVEWSGVGDWLDALVESDITKLSRGEVERFVDENGVRVEEKMLGEADPPQGFRLREAEYGWYFEGPGVTGNGKTQEEAVIDTKVKLEREARRWQKNGDEAKAQRFFERADSLDAYIEALAGKSPDGKDTVKYNTPDLVLPGGKDYRELLLTLPAKDTGKLTAWQTKMAAKYGSNMSTLMTDAEKAEGIKAREAEEAVNQQFRAGHYDEPNVLAHIRFDSRTDANGKRVLFVQEFQSDWAQRGRKEGFSPDKVVKATVGGKDSYGWPVNLVDGGVVYKQTLAEAELLRDEINERGGSRKEGIPAAPFVGKTEAWVALALKRMIRYAADNGYDAVAWTTGAQQAARYDLSKKISKLHWHPTTGGKTVTVVLAEDRKSMSLDIDATGKITEELFWGATVIGKNLDEVIGKELAKRVLESPKATMTGVDLKVGGEGMLAFYDKMVPNIANDLLKKLGGGRVTAIGGIGRDNALPIMEIEQRGLDWKVVDAESGELVAGQPRFYQESDASDWIHEKTENAGGLRQPGFYLSDAIKAKAAEGMPLFARATWDSPEPSRLTDAIYALVDKQIDLKSVIAAIKATGRQIAEDIDAYLQETLYHGRAADRTKDFVERELNPLLSDMAARGVTLPEFETYLHNRHAEERNIQIAKVNLNMPDGGSGIDTADARAYLRGLDPAKRFAYEALARKVDAITAETRAALVSYGLESQATMDAWERTYSKYVPLYREEGDEAPGIGQGFSVKGAASKRATGSSAGVVDILANVATQRERAIIRGEKARVSLALYGLAKANPNPEFWQIDTPRTIKEIDKRTGLVTEYTDPRWKDLDEVVVARFMENGEIVERAVVFNKRNPIAKRMALALKNLDTGDLGTVLGTVAKGTRYIAAMSTQYNPVFGVVNLMRDTGTATFNLSTTPIHGKQAAVAGNILSALKGIYLDVRAERAGGMATSPWAALWEEFKAEGGQTGYRDMFATSQERSKALVDEIGKATSNPAKLAVRIVGNWLSDYNTAMENAVRLSAYKVGVESGMSKARAAAMAKELTVNFNRKGQMGTQIGAAYAFFNASVQGSARLFETIKGPQGKKIVAGGMAVGVLQALALAAAGFDDDEPPEFVRERSLIIPIGDKKYVTLPMPLGFHVLPSIGRIATEYALSGFHEPLKRATQLAGVIAESFNPIGSAGLSLQTLSPTLADPFIALAENRDWTGKPIYRESFGIDGKPGSARSKDTATVWAKMTAEAINWLSGGTEHSAGMLSPVPDQIDYLIGQATGGVGREISKAAQTAQTVVTGEALPAHKVPLFGRFYGDAAAQTAHADRFYESLKTMAKHEAEVKGRVKARQDVAEYFAQHPEARLWMAANGAERAVSQMRQVKRSMLKRGANPADVAAIELRISMQMAKFNEMVARARGY